MRYPLRAGDLHDWKEQENPSFFWLQAAAPIGGTIAVEAPTSPNFAAHVPFAIATRNALRSISIEVGDYLAPVGRKRHRFRRTELCLAIPRTSGFAGGRFRCQSRCGDEVVAAFRSSSGGLSIARSNGAFRKGCAISQAAATPHGARTTGSSRSAGRDAFY